MNGFGKVLVCCLTVGSLLCSGNVSAQEKDGNTVGGFTFTGKQLTNGYLKTFKSWAQQDEKEGNVPAKDKVLCVGSSSMRMWGTIKRDLSPLEVIHRGFGGSTMSQVLIYQDFFARYKAKTIVVYEGDNDLMGKTTPEQFLANCKTFVAAMQAANPEAQFYFLPAKPSVSRWGKWEKFSKSNQLLKAYCDETENLTYTDIATPMLGEDGTPMKDIFRGDNLHMNPKGYAIWTKVLRKQLISEELIAAMKDAYAKASTDSFCVKFGDNIKDKGWDCITTNSLALPHLANTGGEKTAVSLTVTKRFSGVNKNGTKTPKEELGFPPSASENSLYGDDQNNKAVVEIEGLNKDNQYKFTFFASRMGVKDNRETDYELVGASTEKVTLNVAANTDKVAEAVVKPTEDGKVLINISKGSNNDNSKGYLYLGALKITKTE